MNMINSSRNPSKIMAILRAALMAAVILLASKAYSESDPKIAAQSKQFLMDSSYNSQFPDNQTSSSSPSSSSSSSSSSSYSPSSPSSSSPSSTCLKSTAMFAIGDSSVDCGENTLLYPLLHQNLSLFPCTNGSDSSLIPYFLAEKMGLPEIPSFYEQNGTIEGILNGLSYGSAQATVLSSQNGPSFQSLNQQLRQAFETIQLLQLQLGQAKADQFIRSSIFYLSLGKDDYINYFFPDNPSSSSSSSSLTYPDGKAFARLVVDEMTQALRDLYDQGARKVVAMGVLPLGCAPRVVVNWYFAKGRKSTERRCVGEINDIILEHNRQLSERIIDLNLEYNDANFVFCDVYQGIMQMMSKPHKYGFEDVRGACCGEGWHGAAVGCQSMDMACNETSTHLWWDFYNPTEAANSLLADSAWSGQPLADICRPLSIRGLVDASS